MSASPIFTVPSPFTSPHKAAGIVVVVVDVVVVAVVVVVDVLVVVVGKGSVDWCSNAPMSHLVLPVPERGNPVPRWSVVGGGQSAPPLSSAGLPAKSACVNVGPLLLASGAIAGSVLTMSPVPWQRLFVQVVPEGQLGQQPAHVPETSHWESLVHAMPKFDPREQTLHASSQLVPTSILCPPDVKFPLNSSPVHASLIGSCAKMVYLNVAVPRLKKAPAPCEPLLLLMVTATSVAVPLSCSSPAPVSAVLP